MLAAHRNTTLINSHYVVPARDNELIHHHQHYSRSSYISCALDNSQHKQNKIYHCYLLLDWRIISALTFRNRSSTLDRIASSQLYNVRINQSLLTLRVWILCELSDFYSSPRCHCGGFIWEDLMHHCFENIIVEWQLTTGPSQLLDTTNNPF